MKNVRVYLSLLVALLCLLLCAGALAETELPMAVCEGIPTRMDGDVEITILADNEFGVNVKYNGAQIGTQVKVRLWSSYKNAWITGTTVGGGLKFLWADFVGPINVESPGYLYTKISVNPDRSGGMAPFEAERFCFHAGKPSTIVLGSASGAYVQSLMYNGEDMLRSSVEMSVTARNDANQTIRLVVGGGSGSSGSATLWQDGKQLGDSVSASRSNDVFTFDFVGKWAAVMLPGKDVSVKYSVGSQSVTVPAQLKIKQAKMQMATTDKDGSFKMKGGESKTKIPKAMPMVGLDIMTLKVPSAGMFYYMDTEGDVLFGYDSSGSPVSDGKKGINGTKWKTASREEMFEWIKDATNKMVNEAHRLKTGVGVRKGVASQVKFLSEFSASLVYSAVAMGKIDTTTWIAQLQGAMGYTLKLGFSHTQEVQLGPMPAFVNLTLGMDTHFGMVCKIKITNAQNIFKGEWDFSDVAWEFRMKFSISVTIGAGVEHIASAYAEGGAFIEPAITVGQQTDPAKPYPHTTVAAGAYVKVGVEIFFTKYELTLYEGKWPHLYDDWRKKLAQSGDASAVSVSDVSLSDEQITQVFEDTCIGEFNADGTFKADAANTDAILASLQVVTPTYTGDTMQANIVKVLSDTYTVANAQLFGLDDDYRAIMFIASAKHSGGYTCTSLVAAALKNDGSIDKDSMCIVDDIDGEVYEYDAYYYGGQFNAFDVVLTYRQRGTGKNRPTFVRYTQFKSEKVGSKWKLSQNVTNVDKTWAASTFLYNYQDKIPRIMRHQGSQPIDYSISIVYCEHWKEGWDTDGDTYLYGYMFSGSWSGIKKIAKVSGALTGLEIYTDNIGDCKVAYTYNTDTSMKTDNKQKLVIAEMRYNTDSAKTLFQQSGDIHNLKCGKSEFFLYVKDKKLCVYSTTERKLMSFPKAIDMPSATFELVLWRDGGKEYEYTSYQGYVIWAENAKCTDITTQDTPTYTVKAVRLDMETGKSPAACSSKTFTLFTSPTRIDQLAIFHTSAKELVTLYTTSKLAGDFTANLYMAVTPEQFAADLVGASVEDSVIAIGSDIVLYLAIKNVGKEYCSRGQISLTGLGGDFDKDYELDLKKTGANHIMTTDDLDFAAIVDQLGSESSYLYVSDLLEKAQVDLRPNTVQDLLAPGEQRTYTLCIPTNKGIAPGKKTLKLKIKNLRGPNTNDLTADGEWCSAIPGAVLLDTGEYELSIDEPDLRVRSNYIDMDGTPYLEVFIGNDSIVPATVSLRLEGLLNGQYVKLCDKTIADVSCGLLDAAGNPVGGCTTLLIPMSSILTTNGASDYSEIRASVCDDGLYADLDWDMQDSVLLGASALLTVSDPANASIPAGQSASFRVTAQGGAPGYTFLWMQKAPGASQYEKLDLGKAQSNGDSSTLALTGVPIERNGYRYYCLVTDANGTVVQSNEALLTVTTPVKPPVTGDSTPLPLLSLCMLLSAACIAVILRVRRAKA